MNLKEAKEHLEKVGYKVQRINESCFSSHCGGSDYDSDPIEVNPRNVGSSVPNTDDPFKDLLDKIPPEKKELVIQLLKALLV